MHQQLARIREAAAESHGGAHVVRVPPCDALRLFQGCLLQLQDTGFAPVLLQRDVISCGLPPELGARHGLLVCGDADGRQMAIRWIRRLALMSPRRHLVVLMEEAQPVSVPREPDQPPGDRSVAGRVARAERWSRLGRFQAADRWLQAAAFAARRRGDDTTAVRLQVESARRLIDRDCLIEGERRLRQVFDATNLNWLDHAAAAAAWLDMLIGRSEFARARAWLQTIAAEAALRGDLLPASVRSRQVELRFWEGRPPPALVHTCADAEETGWRALSLWQSGNLPALASLASRLTLHAKSANASALWWGALIRVVLATGTGEADMRARIETLMNLGATQPRARRRHLAHVVTAKVLAARGQPADARMELSSVTGQGPECMSAARLLVSLTGMKPRPARRDTEALPGVEFLGGRSTSMELVNGLSALLSIVEDAEDDAGVLSGGCRWVCRQAGATAVAVVSADAATLVAAEGWKRSDLGGEITALASGPSAVAVRYGGARVGVIVAKGPPGDRAAIEQAVQALAAVCGSALRARLDAMSAPARSRDLVPEIVGDSPLMQSVREAIARAAAAPFPVLIEGESGTGKELVARALHRLGPRRDRRLCAVNCAALSDDLVEAELFGHTRGAFTGAVGARTGLFEEASGGTLFFDEVAELSPRAQAKLLRALQEREIRRVGENTARPVDVRVIAATNTNLVDAVAAGRFRDDLRFRLAVVRIRLPPLRERLEDIASLAHVFWRRTAAEAGTRATLTPDAVARLTRHAWPGNVRELQNVISSLAVSGTARGRVAARHVDQVLNHSAPLPDPVVRLDAARRTFERRTITAALVQHAGRRAAAADALGLTRQGLSKALRRLGLADEGVGGEVAGPAGSRERPGLSATGKRAGVA